MKRFLIGYLDPLIDFFFVLTLKRVWQESKEYWHQVVRIISPFGESIYDTAN